MVARKIVEPQLGHDHTRSRIDPPIQLGRDGQFIGCPSQLREELKIGHLDAQQPKPKIFIEAFHADTWGELGK
jgi:hypothetical protein